LPVFQSRVDDIEYTRMKFFKALNIEPRVIVEESAEGSVRDFCIDYNGNRVEMGDLIDFNAIDHSPAIFLGEKLERDHMFAYDVRGHNRLIWYRYFLGPEGLFTADAQWPFKLISRMVS
jgi:hypothetical protein